MQFFTLSLADSIRVSAFCSSIMDTCFGEFSKTLNDVATSIPLGMASSVNCLLPALRLTTLAPLAGLAGLAVCTLATCGLATLAAVRVRQAVAVAGKKSFHFVNAALQRSNCGFCWYR